MRRFAWTCVLALGWACAVAPAGAQTPLQTPGTLPDPLPLARNGGCPTGYSSSGNYCVPGPSARFALARTGSCPTGYFSSGNYCVASNASSRAAIPRSGSCPSGWFSSGDYCVSSR